MKDEIAEWLLPMLNEVSPADLRFLLLQASFPAAETDTPLGDWMAGVESTGCGVRVRAVDWIEFGRLLRQKLAWSDYPDSPCLRNGRLVNDLRLGSRRLD